MKADDYSTVGNRESINDFDILGCTESRAGPWDTANRLGFFATNSCHFEGQCELSLQDYASIRKGSDRRSPGASDSIPGLHPLLFLNRSRYKIPKRKSQHYSQKYMHQEHV